MWVTQPESDALSIPAATAILAEADLSNTVRRTASIPTTVRKRTGRHARTAATPIELWWMNGMSCAFQSGWLSNAPHRCCAPGLRRTPRFGIGASAKGTHGTLFDGLRPVISVRDGKPGGAELRLVAGPLSNASAAAKICASLAASGWTCRPAVFDGQRLAIR